MNYGKIHYPFVPLVQVGLCENVPFGLHPHGDYDINASEDTIIYTPVSSDSYMEVRGVTIGCGFHWQQKCDLHYKGVMRLSRDTKTGQNTLINILPVEDYLKSVISSEMDARALPEYLKAHAIISRTWLMRILSNPKKKTPDLRINDNTRIITFTQHDSHDNYDVCADDHCQRYQGITDINEAAVNAVDATKGIVLTDNDGEIIDARFSKCCGGHTEKFSVAWDDIDYDYLCSKPDPYCNPESLSDAEHLQLYKFIKDFDRNTPYYKWDLFVPDTLIRQNLSNEYGIDIGEITGMTPVKTGESGRIQELLIIGSYGRIIIGKELAIRRLLSSSHLYSSAFKARRETGGFHLDGYGWGHGVGLCQLGAATMAIRGYSAAQILEFYYPNTLLSSIYD